MPLPTARKRNLSSNLPSMSSKNDCGNPHSCPWSAMDLSLRTLVRDPGNGRSVVLDTMPEAACETSCVRQTWILTNVLLDMRAQVRGRGLKFRRGAEETIRTGQFSHGKGILGRYSASDLWVTAMTLSYGWWRIHSDHNSTMGKTVRRLTVSFSSGD